MQAGGWMGRLVGMGGWEGRGVGVGAYTGGGMFVVANLVLSALVLWGAFALWRRARVWERVDRHVICAKCGQDLHGNSWQLQVCPECGNSLTDPASMRVGNRRRHGVMMGVAVGLFVLGGGGVVGTAMMGYGEFDWQKSKPAWVLQYEAFHGGGNTRQRAFDELYRRFTAQTVSPLAVASLVPTILERQKDMTRVWYEPAGDLLQRLRNERVVSDRDWTEYGANYLTNVAVALPGKVWSGEPVLLELGLLPRGGYEDPFQLLADVTVMEEGDGEKRVVSRTQLCPMIVAPPAAPMVALRSFTTVPLPMEQGLSVGDHRLVVRTVLRLIDRRALMEGKSGDRALEMGGALVYTNASEMKAVVNVASREGEAGDGGGAKGGWIARLVKMTSPVELKGGIKLQFNVTSLVPNDTQVDFVMVLADGETQFLGRVGDGSWLPAGVMRAMASPTARLAQSDYYLRYPFPGGLVEFPEGAKLVIRPVATVPAASVADGGAYLPRVVDLETEGYAKGEVVPKQLPTRMLRVK